METTQNFAAKKPTVLFCDEPTGALDSETAQILDGLVAGDPIVLYPSSSLVDKAKIQQCAVL